MIFHVAFTSIYYSCYCHSSVSSICVHAMTRDRPYIVIFGLWDILSSHTIQFDTISYQEPNGITWHPNTKLLLHTITKYTHIHTGCSIYFLPISNGHISIPFHISTYVVKTKIGLRSGSFVWQKLQFWRILVFEK